MARRLQVVITTLDNEQRLVKAADGYRLLLWLRLVDAIGALSGGASLTDAAHRTGFSDSAHLSRTFRRMFGMAPSLLVSSHVAIHGFAAGSPAAPWWAAVGAPPQSATNY
ncbi:MAG TPA: helix-turn-helix domain-containing protein [Mycobacterium sp.]|nr:helix-turn-helix domain-containing protein [Mycobacterium sp.]